MNAVKFGRFVSINVSYCFQMSIQIHRLLNATYEITWHIYLTYS